MADTFLNIREGILIVSTASELPSGVPIGTPAVTADTGDIYTYDGIIWNIKGATAGAGIISLNGQTGTTQLFANGATGTTPSFSSSLGTHTLNIPLASSVGVLAGLISKSEYDTFNNKQNTLTFGNISTTTTGVTITGGSSSTVGPNVAIDINTASFGVTGLLSGTDWNTFNSKQGALSFGNISTTTSGISIGSGSSSTVGPNVTINISNASGVSNGLLTSSDWTTFNNKQSSLTIGNLTTATTGVSVSGGTGSVIGSGTTVNIQTANGSQPGLLSSTDWTTFNNKLSSSTNFINLTAQGSAPSTPASGVTLYANASHQFSWRNTSGFITTIDGVITANRAYNFPDISGNILLNSYLTLNPTTVSGNITISATDQFTIYLVDTSAARDITLPNPSLVTNRVYVFKDIIGSANTNNITLNRFGSEKIEGLTSSKIFSSSFGSWMVFTNGTDWFLI